MAVFNFRDILATLETVNTKTLFLSSGIILALFLVVSTAVQWSRLRHIPGPVVASLTSLWAYRHVGGMGFHKIAINTQEKYGEIVRIGPNDVMISDPEELWRINSARSTYTRGKWYSSIRFNPYGDSVFSELDTVKHDKRKAKLNYGFSGKGLMDLEGNVDVQLGILVDVLRKKTSQGPAKGAVVDIGRFLQYFQVDLISYAGMGQAWGNMVSEKDHHGYMAEADVLLPFVHRTSMVPWLRSILFSRFFLGAFGPSNTEGWLGILANAVKSRVIQEKTGEHGGDMLDEWLKHGLSPTEAELDLSVQVPAGTETSISTIRSILMFLMTSPNTYQKLKQEISGAIKQGLISSPATNEEAKNLRYLQAVIYEGMRMAPPLMAGFPKQVPPGGDVVCGKALPAGTAVHVNFIALMRHESVFGQDANVFRPERFLECDEATRLKMVKVIDLNFGHGRWLCLGRVLALIEMNKIFVELFRVFDFQLLNHDKPWKRESTLTWYIRGFHALVTENPIG
ncbi:cytochrome P450 [Xylariales sp. PMI_506]|nr:cytochrome P450 [Xylariales sp. PMI_506]